MRVEKTCPYCGSDNVLPFEDDTPSQGDDTLFIVLVSAFFLIGGYFLVMISVYLFFPLAVFAAIIIVTRWINKQEQGKKKKKIPPHDYVCMDCGQFFYS